MSGSHKKKTRQEKKHIMKVKTNDKTEIFSGLGRLNPDHPVYVNINRPPCALTPIQQTTKTDVQNSIQEKTDNQEKTTVTAKTHKVRMKRNSSWSSLLATQPGVYIVATVSEKFQDSEQQLFENNIRSVFDNLDGDRYQDFYSGQCNGRLWAVFHVPEDINNARVEKFDQNIWKHYREVNQRLADKTCEQKQRDDTPPTIWVHDYQLMLEPGMIREKTPDANIGYFHHIPWPNWETLEKHLTPEEVSAILLSLCTVNHIAFHTERDQIAFLKSVNGALKSKNKAYDPLKKLVQSVDLKTGTIHRHEQSFLAPKVLPLGVDFDERSTISDSYQEKIDALPSLKNFAQFKQRQDNDLKDTWKQLKIDIHQLANNETEENIFYKLLLLKMQEKEKNNDISRLYFLGVDREDITKGFESRLDAIDGFFERFPIAKKLVTFVMLNSPTRTKVPEYQKLQKQIHGDDSRPNQEEGRLGELRKKYGNETIYTLPSMPSDNIPVLHRLADSPIVTSRKDGLHLLPPEMIAAHANKKNSKLSPIISLGAGIAHVLKKAEKEGHLKPGDITYYKPGDVEALITAFATTLVRTQSEVQASLKRLTAFVKNHLRLDDWLKENIAAICNNPTVKKSPHKTKQSRKKPNPYQHFQPDNKTKSTNNLSPKRKENITPKSKTAKTARKNLFTLKVFQHTNKQTNGNQKKSPPLSENTDHKIVYPSQQLG
jgi:trehalose-6-phosphate synthase